MGAVRPDVFQNQPALTGELVRLEPLTEAVLDDYLLGMADAEVRRLTATHAEFDRPQIQQWLASRAEQHDRADWAVLRRADGLFLGEAVLNDFDPDNASANYRVWLAGSDVYGKGYGTEATRLVLDHAFGTAGLHRVSLGVLDFNPRARRVYEKCGFQLEGRLRHAVRWDGEWHDELVMSVLSTDLRPPPDPGEKPAQHGPGSGPRPR
jgi:RimJ/RimL family protein N-acetyltransferase